MKKGNVLVIGNSGVGKSTLINAILGDECAKTGRGTEGTTKSMTIYERDDVPFRIIDTMGFEPSFIKTYLAIRTVKKWSAASTKAGKEDTQINAIWFCVDGQSSKIFDENIRQFSRAIAAWPSVPIIAVITKSYSVPEREKNIELVYNAFAKQKRSINIRKVIPVVASVFTLNESAYAPPEGITELIDATLELMPEGLEGAAADVAAFKLGRKRVLAHSVVGAVTAAAVVVGAVPIPFSDAALLAPLELGMLNSLAGIYGINKDEKSKNLLNSIVEVGTVGVVAKGAISALKAIPGLSIGVAAINAVIAGSIVAALGEGAVYVFEQIYLGHKGIEDTFWIMEVFESKFSTQFIQKTTDLLKETHGKVDAKRIIETTAEE